MFKVTEAMAIPFQVFDLTVERFNRAVRKAAVIQASGTMFFDHDKRIDDRFFVFGKNLNKVHKDITII